jgi:hypothetical protein
MRRSSEAARAAATPQGASGGREPLRAKQPGGHAAASPAGKHAANGGDERKPGKKPAGTAFLEGSDLPEPSVEQVEKGIRAGLLENGGEAKPAVELGLVRMGLPHACACLGAA